MRALFLPRAYSEESIIVIRSLGCEGVRKEWHMQLFDFVMRNALAATAPARAAVTQAVDFLKSVLDSGHRFSPVRLVLVGL